MKTRIETKESIRRKSVQAFAARSRRRRAALSAACMTLAIGAAGIFWLRGSRVDSEGDSLNMGAPPPESDYAVGAVDNGAVRGLDDGELDQEMGAMDDIYSAYNAAYAAPDSMRVYTLPNGEEVSLSAQNADENEIITQMSAWISALDVTQTYDTDNDSDITYVVERRYGENLSTVRVRGRQIQFGGGEWLAFSAEDEEEFRRIMQEIKWNSE